MISVIRELIVNAKQTNSNLTNEWLISITIFAFSHSLSQELFSPPLPKFCQRIFSLSIN